MTGNDVEYGSAKAPLLKRTDRGSSVGKLSLAVLSQRETTWSRRRGYAVDGPSHRTRSSRVSVRSRRSPNPTLGDAFPPLACVDVASEESESWPRPATSPQVLACLALGAVAGIRLAAPSKISVAEPTYESSVELRAYTQTDEGPDPPHIDDEPHGTDDDAGPPCDAPLGCPCLYGALDTFVADDDECVDCQPQKSKRPNYLADVSYPVRGGLDRIPVDVFMNGATSLEGFKAEISGTGTHTDKNRLVEPTDDPETGTAEFKLKFAPSTGIRTRTWAYELVDTSGTCPTSKIHKRANVYPKWMPYARRAAMSPMNRGDAAAPT